MRVVVSLGGTDCGRSGLGVYVRAVVPRLRARLAREGGSLLALGTARDLRAYADALGGVARVEVPALCDAPAAGALWHLLRAGDAAHGAGADVLLLAAANRRATARSRVPTVAVVHDLGQLRV